MTTMTKTNNAGPVVQVTCSGHGDQPHKPAEMEPMLHVDGVICDVCGNFNSYRDVGHKWGFFRFAGARTVKTVRG